MRKAVLFGVLVVLCLSFSAFAEKFCKSGGSFPSRWEVCTETLFVSPDDKYRIKNKVESAIYEAEQRIRIAVSSFTYEPLAYAVIYAHRHGVDVRILIGDGEKEGQHSRLDAAGIPVLVVEPAMGCMNHKFAVIDELVITGSHNWAELPDEGFFENAVFIEWSAIAQSFVEEFDRIWEELEASQTPEKSPESSPPFLKGRR